MKRILNLILFSVMTISSYGQIFPCLWSGVGTPPNEKGVKCQYVYHTTSDSIWFWNGTVYELTGQGGGSGVNDFYRDTDSLFLVSGTDTFSVDAPIGGVGNINLDVYRLPAINQLLPAYGLNANESVTNYDFTTVDQTKYKFSTTALGTTSIEYGGWLANGTSGDSIAISAPFGVVIGDSQAEGHPARHGRLHPNAVATFSANYQDTVGTISYTLRQKTNMRWFNHGIGSQTSDQVWARWSRDVLANIFDPGDGRGSKTLERKPNIVIIIVGINDFYVHTTRSWRTTAENFENMARSARDNGIIAVFLNCPGDEVITLTQARKIDSLNMWMSSGALQAFGAVVVDYNSWWRDPAYNDNAHGNSLIADDIHPTAVGYDSLANIIFRDTKLPVITGIKFINKLSPAGFSGYSRPANITIQGIAHTISSDEQLIPFSTPMEWDSTWIYITSSTNITGTTYSGFSHIEWVIANDTTDLYTRNPSLYSSYQGTAGSLFSRTGTLISPSTITDRLALGTASASATTTVLTLQGTTTDATVHTRMQGSTGLNPIVFTNNGRVGINQASAIYNLHVNGTMASETVAGYSFWNGPTSQIFANTPRITMQSSAINTGGTGRTDVDLFFDGSNYTIAPPGGASGGNFKFLVRNKLSTYNFVVDVNTNRLGNVITPTYGVDFSGARDGLVIPSGTTAQRGSTGGILYGLRMNTDSSQLEITPSSSTWHYMPRSVYPVKTSGLTGWGSGGLLTGITIGAGLTFSNDTLRISTGIGGIYGGNGNIANNTTATLVANGFFRFLGANGTEVISMTDGTTAGAGSVALYSTRMAYLWGGDSTVIYGGSTQFKNPVTSVQGRFNLFEARDNGTNSIRFQSPLSLASDYTLTWPTNDGDNNQILTTDGSGGLSWTANNNGIISALPVGDVLISTDNELKIRGASTISDSTFIETFSPDVFAGGVNVLKLNGKGGVGLSEYQAQYTFTDYGYKYNFGYYNTLGVTDEMRNFIGTARGTQMNPLPLQKGDRIGGDYFYARGTSSFRKVAVIRAEVDSIDVSNNPSARLIFGIDFDNNPEISQSWRLVVEDAGVISHVRHRVFGDIETNNGLSFYNGAFTSNKVRIVAPSLTGDYTLTLPLNDGDNNQVLTTNGSGGLSWVTNNGVANLSLSGTSPILLESSTGTDIKILNSAASAQLQRRSTDSLVLIQLNPMYTSLVSLDSAIASTTTSVIVVDTEVTVTAGLDFPATKQLIFVKGGKLVFNTATISDFFCSIQADDYQNIFQFNVAPSTCINPGTNLRSVSVCWFGAISGDGLDDSQAGNYATEFLDLVNDVSTSKGTVLYYPSGEFNNYGTVKIWSFMTVTGAGMNSTTVHGAKNNTQSILEASPVGHAASYSRSTIFRIGDWTVGVENVTVKDMFLQGYYGIVTDGVQAAMMADIGYATKEQYHKNLRFENLHCDSIQSLCAFFRAGGREFPDESTWFRHKNIQVLNCVIENTGNKAIELQECEDIIITGNIIKAGQDGIQLIHSCRRGVISNNRVDFEDTGIAIANGGEEVTITGNVVYWTGLGLDPLSEPNGFGGALHMKWDNYISGSPGGTGSEPVFNVVIADNVFDVTASSTNAIRSMAWHWGTGWTTASVTRVKIVNNIFRHRSDALHAISPHVRPTTTTWDDIEFIGNSFYAGTFGDVNQTTTGQVRLVDNFIEGNSTFNQLDSMVIKDNIFEGTVTIASGSVNNLLKDNVIKNTLTTSAATVNINSQPPSVETSTTGTINWLYRDKHIVQLDFTTGSSETVTLSNPLSGATYTLVCINMGATPTITWATQPINPDGTNVASNIVQTKPVLTFYYNGTNYILIN